MVAANPEPTVFQGQFGEFTITPGDRFGVIAYRGCLLTAALCFAAGTALVLSGMNHPGVPLLLDGLSWGFLIALGGSLLLIHIYMAFLHRTLQLFWLIGTVAAVVVRFHYAEPVPIAVYHHPLSILGVGFAFAALTGIFFKEAFCFNRLETKALTPLVPLLLLGHLFTLLPMGVEKGLLATWAVLMMIFALRKTVQAIPGDIGDKSVFEHLKHQKNQGQKDDGAIAPTP
jgi:uncharacterized integral membrane protein